MFLDKYNPEQFEIIGILQSSTDVQAGIPSLRRYDDFKELRSDGTYTGNNGRSCNGFPILVGKSDKGNFFYNEKTKEYVHCLYCRLLIKYNK